LREINLDALDLDAVAALPVPEVEVDPLDAAYVLYTSGSTGTPKGVVVTCAGIANRVAWAVGRHGLGPGDRVLQKTALTFDAHCWEVFGPLACGATVVLAPEGAERDPAALMSTVEHERITVLQVVPSVLRLLVEEPGWARCRELRLLFSAGEALHAELVHQVLAQAPWVAVWNTYGPTECAIDVTAYRFDPAQRSGPVPIGRPLDELSVLLLDEEGLLVPPGVTGELYAAGPGVARGYLGRPDLTAARFVPHPYGEPGERLYRTGDLARWRSDGVLEYLGRGDDQVKVNGVRIEPHEIEAVLAAHPGLRGAVVLPVSAPDGSYRLAAYVTGPEVPDAAGLRGYLRDRLPETHLPAVFVALDAFPLNASGKVDRAALPVPGSEPAPRAPASPTEELVAEVWRELLKVDAVGAADDFFALGGTSLQLTRLANRLRTRTGQQIPLRGLFGATTVEAQARLLEPAAADAIPRLPRDGRPLPLSAGQRRLWYLEQLEPGRAEWVSPLLLRVPAQRSGAEVRRALAALVARHEILRTRYSDVDGEPVAVLAEPGPVELREAELAPDLLATEFGRGFDLATGPVLRALLAYAPGEDHLLVLSVHHIALDGWSSVLLERELRALLAGAELPEPPLQYADYAAWQRGRSSDAELAYWRGALAGVEPLPLPTDRPRRPVRDPRGAMVPVRIPADLARAATELGRRHGATPFMVVLTAYATLLARYAGRWDVPVGVPVAGRNRPELEQVVGFLLNSVVVRADLAGSLPFEQALARVAASTRDALAHQEVPFDRLVEALEPARDPSRTPLYQAAFDLHDDQLTGSVSDEADVAAFARAWRTAHTDLTLYQRRAADGSYTGYLEYATALFDESTVERLAGYLVRLLRAAVADPRVPLAELSILDPAELEFLLDTRNATAAPRDGAYLPELIEARAAATPDAVAVSQGGRRMSYVELVDRARRTAGCLRARGVRRGDRVAVLLDPGPELLATLLGVWFAGAAYVPLDPGYPAERVGYVVADAGAAVAVTQPAYAARFAGSTVVMDADAAGRPLSRVDTGGRDLAYVIYTSGSTGRPKGVMVEHEGVTNHVLWAAAELAGRGTGGAPLCSSVAFDLVVPALWAPLACGQAVHVPPAGTDLAGLGAWLASAAPFSFVKLTPGHLEVLTHQLTADQARSLAGVLVVAGEQFGTGLLSRWRALDPDTPVINEYGPTEASVGSTVYPVPAAPAGDWLPIGGALPNVTTYVLDAGLRPVPVGVVGELYVGGTGVARGYAGRPEQTARCFVPDPYRAEPGARMYRSGDLARVLPDGNVSFLGRVDGQVKVRGYRIEPGEIEAVLREHPGVRAAAVLVDGAEQPRLVAYVVSDVDGAELVAYCAARLPAYLVPAACVPVPAIPLNANGKVDRRALPEVAPAATAPAAPANPLEERIAGMLADLLGRPVGADQDFFAAGGNSIHAIQLIARVQGEFGVTLPVRTVFEGPTVALLAAAVEELVAAEIEQMSDQEVLAELSPGAAP
ncbi:MAG TPA: amino acid adenylation domain-containing protein, partial [Rugosimonospora sp.]|nr:amino acid adenylation domain-containing protein [Rugosimonospora sp.]